MKNQLNKLAYIRAGHPFRGRIEEAPDSNEYVVQLKDVDAMEGVAWKSLMPTSVKARGMPYWIESGDILFMARGPRNFAVYVDDVAVKAVCSPHFFHFRLTAEQILPEFLAWQINQEPAQTYFQRSREGSRQPSIRRNVLGALPIAIPSLKTQKQIVALMEKMNEEAQLLAALQEKNQTMMNVIANDICKGKIK